ncbi:hypothetical protein ACET3X_003125 [Alternaria dauci]|uniref:Uncharacterized protein n=1 Tax=Alternaria dauci TaxID=48095 RepID=A0ABR3URM5_9PLEO
MDGAYTTWREGRDLPLQQTARHDSAPTDDGAANKVEDQAGSTPSQRWGKRSRRRGRGRGKNRGQQESTPARRDQTQETAKLSPTIPAEREAATIHFWTNVTPATLFGFSSNAEILATNVGNETRNRSAAEPLLHTDQYREVHRPIEEGESPFDPDMPCPRATAILGGFVEMYQDVGKKRKDWVTERYIFAGEDEERVVNEEEGRDQVNNNPTRDQIGDRKELIPNEMKKGEWYDKKLRKDAARDAKRAAKREALDKGGLSSFGSNLVGNGRDRRPPSDIEAGSAGYDHGGFQDMRDFYTKPAPGFKKFDPDARIFEAGGGRGAKMNLRTK